LADRKKAEITVAERTERESEAPGAAFARVLCTQMTRSVAEGVIDIAIGVALMQPPKRDGALIDKALYVPSKVHYLYIRAEVMRPFL
jgi:hypothetical protein